MVSKRARSSARAVATISSTGSIVSCMTPIRKGGGTGRILAFRDRARFAMSTRAVRDGLPSASRTAEAGARVAVLLPEPLDEVRGVGPAGGELLTHAFAERGRERV